MTDFHKKESPFQGITGFAGGATGLRMSSSAVVTKYVDEVFSTYLYKGNSGTQSIDNGIDLSGKGGLTWIKKRDGSTTYCIVDSERGDGKMLQSNSSDAEIDNSGYAQNLSSNGFTLPADWTTVNNSGDDYTSWSFRKNEGFFDIVTYTGTGSARTVSHNLGVVPGVIMIKQTNATGDWYVYHRDMQSSNPAAKVMYLNTTNEAQTSSGAFNDTEPTSTEFTVGTLGDTNGSGDTFVAYLFAGGESTAATACSVNFNAGSDYLTTQSGTYNFDTGDFTIEFWTKLDIDIGTNATATPGFFQLGTTTGLDQNIKFMSVRARNDSGGRWQMLIKGTSTTTATTYSSADGDYPHPGQWYHVALVRHSSKTSLYINGELKIGPIDDTTNYNFDDMLIGSYYYNNYGLDGQISNFRIVKGSAVYTSSFKPPTAPLTSITNTILLCCQSSTITAATTIPGTQTISSNGSPSANTSHPFDDPAGFKFGENEDKNIVKTGSYIGNGATDGPEVYLGWEPSWLLIKNTTTGGTGWRLFDSMRGIVTNGDGEVLYPNSNSNADPVNRLSLTSTGFKLTSTHFATNEDGSNFIYMAIRMSDGYVGKPADAGTGVFAMDSAGSGVNAIPAYVSGFPVDFALEKNKSSSSDWFASSRLTGDNYLVPNNTSSQASGSGDYVWDSNTGAIKGTWTSSQMAWLFKRHAGFDCITYAGDGGADRPIPHSLNKTVEMAWVKRLNAAAVWQVYHKGLNGGTNPQGYGIVLNDNGAEYTETTAWAETAPTSTYFYVGENAGTNSSGYNFLMLLFASVDGISKVGYYTGNGGAGDTGKVISTGFNPRLVMIKRASGTGNWYILDTTRGFTSSNNKRLKLNSDAAQDATGSNIYVVPLSTGFRVNVETSEWNANGSEYIYYAHA